MELVTLAATKGLRVMTEYSYCDISVRLITYNMSSDDCNIKQCTLVT